MYSVLLFLSAFIYVSLPLIRSAQSTLRCFSLTLPLRPQLLSINHKFYLLTENGLRIRSTLIAALHAKALRLGIHTGEAGTRLYVHPLDVWRLTSNKIPTFPLSCGSHTQVVAPAAQPIS